MSDIKVNVKGGSSKRLLTAGKLCDKDILVEASGAELQRLSVRSNGTYNAPEGVGYSPVVVQVDAQLPDEGRLLTGNCFAKFANGQWDWFLDYYGKQIVTLGLTSIGTMFDSCYSLEHIPFDLIMADYSELSMAGAFSNCHSLTEIPNIRFNGDEAADFSQYSLYLASIFNGCHNVRSFENVFVPEMFDSLANLVYEYEYDASRDFSNMFTDCLSMRSVPTWHESLFQLSDNSSYYPIGWAAPYCNTFFTCRCLDEVTNLKVFGKNLSGSVVQTEDMFYDMLSSCNRLANFTFETESSGASYYVNWQNQTLRFNQTGYFGPWESPIGFNAGITESKRVDDDASYQALKDDPDWWTNNPEYSRYNHDSAVATINSLPSTPGGSNNIIEFKVRDYDSSYNMVDVGSKTDGGAISALTEEEIAEAAFRGWTVAFTE